MPRQLSAESNKMIAGYRQDMSTLGVDTNELSQFDPGTVLAVFELFSKLMTVFKSLCPGKPVPVTPPIPTPLVTQGIGQDSWEKAFQGNWLANEAWDTTKQRYRQSAVNHAAKELGQQNNTKPKHQKAAAVAAFNTARLNQAVDLAVMAHDAAQPWVP